MRAWFTLYHSNTCFAEMRGVCNNRLTRYELSLRLFPWLLTILFSSSTLDELMLTGSSAPWTPGATLVRKHRLLLF